MEQGGAKCNNVVLRNNGAGGSECNNVGFAL